MSSDTQLSKQFVKAVRKRMLDLDWSAEQFCEEAKIGRTTWSQACTGSRPASINTINKGLAAVGLKADFTPIEATP